MKTIRTNICSIIMTYVEVSAYVFAIFILHYFTELLSIAINKYFFFDITYMRMVFVYMYVLQLKFSKQPWDLVQQSFWFELKLPSDYLYSIVSNSPRC